jgi:L-ascorbate metabolism protein UlaG (beta-lactamase superfamily)
VTGDTLYNERIFSDLPEHIDYVFLPVNGVGNNMNMTDAKRFCERIGAFAVPMHCGLFDEKDMHCFEYENKIVPEFYKEIKLI